MTYRMLIMIHKKIHLLCFSLTLLLSVVFAHGAQAQIGTRDELSDEPYCGIEYKVIMGLKVPELGAYSVWDTIWGEVGEEEFFQTGDIIAGAQLFLVGKKKAILNSNDEVVKPERLLVARTRDNGRIRWMKEYDLPNFERVVKILKDGRGGYYIFANIYDQNTENQMRKIWIGSVNKDGELESSKEITHKTNNIRVNDVIPMPETAVKMERAHFLMSAAAPVVAKGEMDDVSTIIYQLDHKMNIVKERAIILGKSNGILELRRTDGSSVEPPGYFGVGYSYNNHDKKVGWLVKLDDYAGVMWQRQYPRGVASELVAGDFLMADAIVMVGTSAPLIRDGVRSSWAVAASRADGRVIWERFFTGEVEYFGKDLVVNDNGLVAVMMDGEVPPEDATATIKSMQKSLDGDEEQDRKVNSMMSSAPDFVKESKRPHVRLITLNPRGVVMGDNAYYNAQALSAHRILLGEAGERIMIGETKARYTIDEKRNGEDDTDAVVHSFDGWVAEAVPAPDYEDPCQPKPYRGL